MHLSVATYTLLSGICVAVDHEQMDKQSRHGGIGQMVSPLKLMQRMKGSTSESLLETNRKMQRALEEALMKNIHLQKVWA